MTKETGNLVSSYIYFTKAVFPALARSGRRNWPVFEDHCFQRIVLDHVCGGVWYEYLDRPAYKHLNYEQAKHAVGLCQRIVEDSVDLRELNQKSLLWRGKLQTTP